MRVRPFRIGAPTLAVLALCAGSVLAQTPQTGPVPLHGGAAASGRGWAGLDLSLCQTLVTHRPAPDVAYRPGVDVHDRAVAPADLPGSGGQPPLPIDLPVSPAMARSMGIALPSVPGLPDDMTAAWLTVAGDRLFLNGQPLEPAAEERLALYCRAR